MAKQNRETLKQYFQTGNLPTQAQFADLLDSALNQTDDSITCDADGQIGVGSPTPAANLNVRGRLFTPLSGTLSVKKGGTTAVGTGTSFDGELAADDAIQISQQRFTVAGVTDSTHLELDAAATAAIEDAVAYRDANLLLIENGNGDTQFVIDKSGNVGIGTAAPTARLHVIGKVQATELAGKGAGITNLNAANLEGTLNPAQLPRLTAEQIPDLPPSKIIGPINGDQIPALTAEQIPELPPSKISGQLKPDQIPPLTPDQLSSFPAEKITGQLKPDQIPTLTADQIPDLPASKITGQLQPDQLPGLPPSPDSGWVEELKQALSVFDGYVTIGPGWPFTELAIFKYVPGALGPILTLMNSGGGAGSGAAIDFDGWGVDPDTPPTARIQSVDDGEYSSHLTFHTKEPGAANHPLAERLRINSDGNVGIGTATPGAKLDIRGADGETVLSAGAVSGATCKVNLAGHVELGQYGDSKQAYFQAGDDSDPSAIGLVVRVQRAGDAGKERYLDAITIDERGNIGLGTVPSDARLQVPGILRADRLAVSGSGITGIPAAGIDGPLDLTQIPQLPASKIGGPLTVDQIPELPPSKITGAVTGQALGPGGRPLLASGSVGLGTTQNIFQIPGTSVDGDAAYYSLEIYTTYKWFDFGNPAGALSLIYNVMTRTILAGAVTVSYPGFFQVEPLSAGPTQTNHPEPNFPAVSFAIVNDNGQAWVQMQTTPNVHIGDPPPQALYYIYSLI